MTDTNSKVSIIIPSLDGYRQGNVPLLLDDLKRQTFQDFEVQVVKGVRPIARARNKGARQSKAEILIFIDDDIRLGNDGVIENLIKALDTDTHIGLAGVSIRLPEESSWFSRRCAHEIRRGEFPVVDKITDSDMVGGAGEAIRRKLYFEIGGQNENLIRGEDAEFRHKLRKNGYRVAVIPHTWTYHPNFRNLRDMLGSKFVDGLFAAHDFIFCPGLIYECSNTLSEEFVARRGNIYRFFRFVFDRLIFSLLTLRFIRFFYYLSYGLGVSIGIIKYGLFTGLYDRIFKPKSKTTSIKAIIIAAGMGSRLKPLTDDLPKCMLYFKGKTLLQRQLEVFKAYNIENIVVIKGYKQEKIDYPELTYYLNENYKDNNILNSLFYAEEEIEGEVIISYSDILFEKKVLEKLLASDADIAIIVDMDWKENYKGRKHHPQEEAEKVILDANNNVLEIGKILLEKPTVCGEFIGLMKLSPRGSLIIREHFKKAKELYWGKPFQRAATFEKAYLTDILQYMVQQHITVKGVIIRKGWIEIDTVEDFQRLRRDVKRV